MMARLSAAGMTAIRAAPTGSGRPWVTAKTGTLTRKIQRQERFWMSSAPDVGPRAAATAPMAPQTPMANGLR